MARQLQVIKVSDNTRDYYAEIIQDLNAEFQRIKKANPRGFMDEYESRFDLLFVDTVTAKGGRAYIDDNDRYFADFTGDMVDLEHFAATH